MKRFKRFLRWLLLLTLVAALLGLLAIYLVYRHYEPQLPEVATLRDVRFQVPLKVYSRDRVDLLLLVSCPAINSTKPNTPKMLNTKYSLYKRKN